MATSNNVRSIIELFCTILRDNGITDVRAETLRQGKFNRDVITKRMWEVLYDVVCFSDRKSATVTHSNGGQMSYVKKKLQNWGYLSKAFAELPTSLSHGSREILLALGWVIHKQHLFNEIIRRRTSPLHQNILHFTSFPVNGSFGPAQKLRDLTSEGKIQRHLMLCGKLKLKLRRLFASHQELAKLHHTIESSTSGVSVQPDINHLTPLEVFLLRYPERLSKMVHILEDDNLKLKRLLEWKEKEQVFWDWMNSVLTLHIEENESDERQESQEEECVLLSVPADVGDQISRLRSQIRDFILGHEDDFDKLEKLIMNKKTSKLALEVTNHAVQKELLELSHMFSLYSDGHFDISGTLDTEEESPVSLHEKSEELSIGMTTSHGRKDQRQQRYLPQTAQTLKASKEAEISLLIKQEIASLQVEVEQLQRELKQAQVDRLNRLQIMTENDGSSICILPRCFKQVLNS